MNTHRITTIVVALAIAGLAQALAAEETISMPSVNDASRQVADEKSQEADSVVPEMVIPVQTVAPPADKLLSNMKVYPSF